MTKLLQALALGTALLATPAALAQRDTPEVKLAKLLEGRTAGAPVDCINLSTTRSSEIIDGKAIVYHSGNRLYVNEPRSGASTLRDDDVLVTRTNGSQLCSIDTVQLVDRGAQFPRGFVMLGKFVPYSKVKRGE
ncbi:hypothetical protein [Sphingomonas sp. M1-B02]|uniref:hypothetical protein n=1 Tax=Sphingomonas sp. M1-B02 TaxID=3114300 RepID=UPI00223E9161|nr:hypothetical protein [Sphingomonas sp. S6-11]UZK67425.1 hypothetical protein OKW87_06225 [Sphingomonas sp. S6-11]